MKYLIKSYRRAIATKNKEEATSLGKEVQTVIDRASSKGLVKKNTAARQKSRLNNKVKEMN